MTDATETATKKRAVPIVFKAGEAWCFGWFHSPHLQSRGVGVVLCRPIGYEAICSYRTYTQFAENLADAGFPVLRFDYHGTGDSAGSDTDTDRVRAWIASIASAADELKRFGGVSRISFFGVRLGATLAVQAAVQHGAVDSIVMWAPCVNGRAFTRELSAARSSRYKRDGNSVTGDIEALGHTYTSQTIQDINSLDCQILDNASAARVLIIDRDDLPGEGPLPAKYRARGIDTTYAKLPGYSGMMVEPHEGAVEHNTLGLITEWLSAAPSRQHSAFNSPVVDAFQTVDPLSDGVREISCAFGPKQSLFGILAEPAELAVLQERLETAILMLNVGGNYRIGPNRLYVKMARSWAASGYRAFRFDLSGIGDSASDSGVSSADVFVKDFTADVRAAIDCLVAKGCKKIVLMGICSGAYLAFQTALVDARITGQILMNPRRLELLTDKADGAWQSAMQRHYKSTHFYRRALFRPAVYGKIFRGEVDLAGIARRFQAVFQGRLKRAFNCLFKPALTDEDVLSKMKRLGVRGTNTLIILAAEDDGRDYIEFHFGSGGHRMRGSTQFRIVVVDESDHTFSSSKSQQIVIANVREHLENMQFIEGPAPFTPVPTLTLVRQ